MIIFAECKQEINWQNQRSVSPSINLANSHLTDGYYVFIFSLLQQRLYVNKV